MFSNDTIVAPATTTGGALSVIRISGIKAIQIANSIFSKNLNKAENYKVIYGNIISKNGDILDDVLLTIFRAPHSYTSEDSVEISCHGSRYILNEVISLIIENGARMALPGEFTQRAFLNGKMDLSQAEAVADLIASNNRSSHRIAMQQMRGGISKKLYVLTNELLHITSLLELELDFSEEDVEFADRTQLLNLANNIKDEIQFLVNSFAKGNAMKNGIPVAIIGAPNVGKSTLLNRILNEDKAIVSEIQGTTRDLVEDTINLSGTLYRFIDTAGIRHTSDKIEQLGIERSIEAASKAEIIILMNEPGVDFPEINIKDGQHIIQVTNKTNDFQAINGIGVERLLEKLTSYAPKYDENEIIISNQRHREALSYALDSINNCLYHIKNNTTSDIVAEELRMCIYYLEQITGIRIDTDTVLGNIFKNFCIGK